MGYACPVCGTPQADDEHLANHLAFTALLGDDDHESWLDEHVAGWGEMGPDELAPEVADLAAETEYETVFDDTTGRDGSDRGESFEDRLAEETGYGRDPGGLGGTPGAADPLDEEARDVLREAHEMTAAMYGDAEDADGADGSDVGGAPDAVETDAGGNGADGNGTDEDEDSADVSGGTGDGGGAGDGGDAGDGGSSVEGESE